MKETFLDRPALADPATRAAYQLGFFNQATILQSVWNGIVALSDVPDREQQVTLDQIVAALEALHDLPKVAVVFDTQEPLAEYVSVDLVKRAFLVNGCIVTGNSALQKEAETLGIDVITVTDLRECLRKHDVITVAVTRAGARRGLGIGHLDDGTLVMVRNGRAHLGQTIAVRIERVAYSLPDEQVVIMTQPLQQVLPIASADHELEMNH